jgi:cell wall-associated NlpC family hydrolase
MSREVHMNRTCLFIATVILAILISNSSYADITYKVRKGDNPYTIAKKFRVSHTAIMRINAIDPDRLKPGMKITIPTQKKENSRTVKSQSVPISREHHPARNSSAEHLQQDEPSFHVVKKGDTIWSIAQRYDLNPDDLMKMNHFESDSLRPGQKILLRDQPVLTEMKPYEAILSQAHEESTDEPLTEHQSTVGAGLPERLILFAKKMLDIPYRFGGNSLLGIDCSAYVKKVYSLIGIDLPRSAREQFHEGIPVDENNLSIGDLVFFRTYASYPSHVGIYLGNNLFIHASSKSKKVTIDSLDTPFYIKRFIGAKRLLDITAKSHDPAPES